MSSRTTLGLSTIAAALLVAACATPHRHMMSSGAADATQMQQMCAMHDKDMRSASPAQQQAAIEEHVRKMHGSADPQMVAMHREMMAKHCAGMAR